MAFNDPYFINVYWSSKFVVENGIVNTFNNLPDVSIVIDHRLSYYDLVGVIYERAGWKRGNANPNLSLLYDSIGNGFRRYAKIKDDASLQVLYFIPSVSSIDLHVHLERVSTYRSHLEEGTKE
ncbi:OLC1v1035852C1 [Oldenlandia corymbosa var. corymbosa]|uniref:OLC1v1035852C1 n=1 Tax=Oldenlandia corymbosa var. corymbosa TaxID=529605 RepID=A0AAV1CV22_OLDCO|nr:OLC1v1035852C1 [Oldenlandia corymbosa var. corymbosa]